MPAARPIPPPIHPPHADLICELDTLRCTTLLARAWRDGHAKWVVMTVGLQDRGPCSSAALPA